MQLLPAQSFSMDTLEHQTLNSGRIVKSPVNRGYSEILNLRYTMNAAAGNNFLDSVIVPVDYIWIVENFSIQNAGHMVRSLVTSFIAAVDYAQIIDQLPVNLYWINLQTNMTFRNPEFLRAYWVGCTAGDVLGFRIHGRIVRVA